MTEYPCGCRNEIHPQSGVLRSLSRCPRHQAARRDPATLDAAYYEELGVLKGGKLAETKHVAELEEALGEFPEAPEDGGWNVAWELGCGASPYVRAIEAAGWRYAGLDASPWAAVWMTVTYGVGVVTGEFDDPTISGSENALGLILAAHVLEHLDDAPGAIVRLAAMLRPGGKLWIVVPDDSDPVNADHEWFFTTAGLRSCLEAAGLAVDGLTVRRHVKHERFIYARARKPA